MQASLDNPIYTVYLVADSKKYNITPALLDISTSDQDKQLAQSVTIKVVNVRTREGDKKTLCNLLKVRQRIFIYADDGQKKDEVFRGWTWTRYHESELEGSVLSIKCYDNLIYLQESEDSLYFSKGKKTSSVMKSICNKWGISLKYSYSSITHSKLVLRGTLSNIIMSDILDLVKKRKGTKYVIVSKKDVMHVKAVGSNKTIYEITTKNDAINVRAETTMDGMITKVKILGQAKKNSQKLPVVATVKGNTSKYGTLQRLQDKDKDTSLSDAKKEAKATIKEHGKPKKQYLVQATDIPWIVKGDAVYVNAGHISGKVLIVLGIERDISNKAKTMTLTLEDAPGGQSAKYSSTFKLATTTSTFKAAKS